MTAVSPRSMANAIRALSMDAVQKANSGHPGAPMGLADVATVLFSKFLKFDPKAPHWPDRDRFILSAGHASMLLYSLLHLTGYEDMTIEQIKNFRQLGSITAGHPEYGHATGIETTTGPLGQGISNSVGFALAERHLNARFGDELMNHKTYVICGDGCLMEGISQEAIGLAGHLKLKNLIVIWDDNNITIDGRVSLADATDQVKRFEASGWKTIRCDGLNQDDVERALTEAQNSDRPVLIAAKTIIGFGSPNKKDSYQAHGSPLGPDEIALARKELDWPYAPFEIPADILSAWRAVGARGQEPRKAWEGRLAASANKAEITRLFAGDLPANFDEVIAAYKKALAANPPALATRNASQNALDVINPAVPETVGGSADLTGSNNTKSKDLKVLDASNYGGRYMHWGIREHGMAAAMNGMALHGGVVPYGGTFLVFADYCRNAIRMSALQRAQVVYVLTHDSIGLGEDGPTHQPIEHVMSLRSIPNLLVFRPADVVETAECWALALEAEATPSVLALSRQNLPQLRSSAGMLSARGAYRLKAADAARQVVLVATGSEVEIAMASAAALEAEGIGADVVSMPCWELFEAQDASYRADILPADVLKVSVEAGVTLGWQKHVGDGLAIGIDRFGASGPAEQLYDYFGLTADKIVPQIKARLGA